MSLQLASAARLKPELRLAQAVSQFEAGLPDAEKKQFRNYRSQSRIRAPNVEDVMRLAAEVDHLSLQRSNQRRCLGPRLINFLQSVQQFTALGDLIVGGSQNIVACGVWALVRFSLLSIVQSSTYLEKTSELLMNVGRSAPRYQSMALLYPRSKALQSHLCEYFIVVVRFCNRLIKVTQKSALGLVAVSLTNSDLKSDQSELEVWASAIKEEVNLLMAKRIEDEAENNSRFRSLASKSIETKSLQRYIQKRLRVLDYCSEYDYETSWKQSRKVGNATIFNLSPEYQAWRQQTNSATLLYRGKLGAGKTVLLASIVDDLILSSEKTDVTVAYFFCRHDVLQSLDYKTIIGSLARQLIQRVSDPVKIEELYDKITSNDHPPSILELLRHVLPADFKAYLILDGLDEMKFAERRDLFVDLRELQDTFAFRLCISVRLGSNNTTESSDKILTNVTSSVIPDVNPDIEAFIESELEHCVKSRKLILGAASLILNIRKALVQGAKGMFLWVTLQIETLCMMESDEDIRHALEHLPKDLPETYLQILKRCKELRMVTQERILRLVAAAHRPLTAEELRESLAVTPGDSVWDPAKHPNDIRRTMSCCGCLLILDEEELTIRVIHPSVKQFLVSGESATGIPFKVRSAELLMAETIITYLSYGVFDTQISKAVLPQLMTGSAPSKIIASTFDSGVVQRLALRLLKTERQVDHDIGQTLIESSGRSKSQTATEFHFLRYARSHWLRHVLDAQIEQPGVLDLLFTLFHKGDIDPNTPDENGRTLLSSAINECNKPMALMLSKVDGVRIDHLVGASGSQNSIVWAARNKNVFLVEYLLLRKDVDQLEKDREGWTALSWAVHHESEAMVAALLKHRDPGALPDFQELDGNPLCLAARQGHKGIVKQLLDSGSFHVNAMDRNGQTPLAYAAEIGHLGVVQLLLQIERVDINSRNSEGQTPLIWAVKENHFLIVEELLLAKETDVNFVDLFGLTALARAAWLGYENIVILLLQKTQIDVNTRSPYGDTPLMIACERGHYSVVVKLLETKDIDVNAANKYGRTALGLAVVFGDTKIVGLLLRETQIDVNSSDADGQTPLIAAIGKGRLNLFQMLLEAKNIDVNAKNNNGHTPLILAAYSGKLGIIEALLQERRTDVNSTDHQGATALWTAAMMGHLEIVRRLVEVGKARCDIADHEGRTPLAIARQSFELREVAAYLSSRTLN